MRQANRSGSTEAFLRSAPQSRGSLVIAIIGLILMVFCHDALAEDKDVLELRKARDDYRFVLKETGKEIAQMVPEAWQGNVRILSPTGRHCGISWPHFLMNSEGNWLTDRVESEGMKLLDLKVLRDLGPVVGYQGQWKFRDYFTSSETHFTWYESAESTQVHLVRARLKILKDLQGITAVWVEFMTRENSYTTAAAMVKGSEVLTLDVGKSGSERNMHYWDGRELAKRGWITIYGTRNQQGCCVALVPLAFSPDVVRPRVNNGHVDNIEIHMLDATQRDDLQQGQEFFLDYLLIVGPDKQDWRWVAPAVERARVYMKQSEILSDRQFFRRDG